MMMRRALACLLVLTAVTVATPRQAAAKRFHIEAFAWCDDCNDGTQVPFQTTGEGFTTRAACERGKREMKAIAKRNQLKITARCVAKPQ
jgi:hypothetical protein